MCIIWFVLSELQEQVKLFPHYHTIYHSILLNVWFTSLGIYITVFKMNTYTIWIHGWKNRCTNAKLSLVVSSLVGVFWCVVE